MSSHSFIKLADIRTEEEENGSYSCSSRRLSSRSSRRSSSRPCSGSSSLLDDEEEESEGNDDSPNGWDSPEEVRFLVHIPTRRPSDLTSHSAAYLRKVES